MRPSAAAGMRSPVDLETATVRHHDGDHRHASTETDRLAAARVATDEEIRIPVMEEELTATVRPQEAGAVRIEKDVVSRAAHPRRPGDRGARPRRAARGRPPGHGRGCGCLRGDGHRGAAAHRDGRLQKQARVAEEVVVSKEAVQRTEQVTGTVRREEVFVDEDATSMRARSTAPRSGSSRPL